MDAVAYEEAVQEVKVAFPEFYDVYKYQGRGENYWAPPKAHAVYLRFAEFAKDTLRMHDIALLRRCLDFMERLTSSTDRRVQDLLGEFLAEFGRDDLRSLESMAKPGLVRAIQEQYERWE